MSASALDDLRRAKQAKNFQTETYIPDEPKSAPSVKPQTNVVTKPQTHRLTVDLDARDFYAFKEWCLAADKQRSERVNMTVVVSTLVRDVLSGRIDPFKE